MLAALLTLALFNSSKAIGQEADEFEYYSTNIFGGVGLLRTRTARFAADGQFEAGASFINPYRNFYLNWQIVPWLEVIFRYTDITNRPGQRPPIRQSTGRFFKDVLKLANSNTFLDRSFDFKFRLAKEGKYMPSVAWGLQDAIGTGVFSGEYLVASKHFGRLDMHLGLGWGQVGSRGNIKNPLRIFGKRFKTRATGFSGTGGQFSFGKYFSGETVGLFGGVEYVTPWEGVTVKFEYNGADPLATSGENVLDEDLPVGIGINYRPWPWFDFGIGWERGNTVSLRFALRSNFHKLGVPKIQREQPVVKPRPVLKNSGNADPLPVNTPTARASTLNDFYDQVRRLGVKVLSFETQDRQARLALSADNPESINQTLEIQLSQLLFASADDGLEEVRLDWLGQRNGTRASIISRESLALLGIIDQRFFELRSRDVRAQSITLKGTDLTLAASGEVPPGEKVMASIAREFADDLKMIGSVKVRIGKETGRYFALAGPEKESKPTKLAGLLSAGTANEKKGGPRDQVKLASLAARPAPGKTVAPKLSTTRKNSAANLSPLPAAQPVPGPAPPPVVLSAEETKLIADPMFQELGANGFAGFALRIEGARAFIYIVNTPFREGPINLSWVSRIAANHLPPEVEAITVVNKLGALEISRVTVMRVDFERHALGYGSPEEILVNAEFEVPQPRSPEVKTGYIRDDMYPAYDWWLAPELQQHIGDPTEGLYLADIDLELGVVYQPTPEILLTAVGRRFLVGNLKKIKRQSNSLLPRVRSDIVRYLQDGKTHIERFQADYISGLAPEWYARASAGLFEGMFGGVGGEVLYRPFDKPYAIAVDVNWVKQRNFNQLFSFRDYEVITGHATLYYDLPFYDMRAIISAGRYLAKDRGVTLDFSRRFSSGIRVGGFATFTNVSAHEFGEGSFDKGFYLVIPLELLLTRRTQQTSVFLFRPLTRDGGQKLAIQPRLFDYFENRKKADFEREWSRMFD